MSQMPEKLSKQINNECDMLKGNINRMCVTNDLGELLSLAHWAKERIDTLCALKQAALMPESLLQDYKNKLARYHRMREWCTTASHEEQLRQEANIIQAIQDCSDALNKLLGGIEDGTKQDPGAY